MSEIPTPTIIQARAFIEPMKAGDLDYVGYLVANGPDPDWPPKRMIRLNSIGLAMTTDDGAVATPKARILIDVLWGRGRGATP